MPLTRVERERITDSQLKIQAVANRLKGVDPQKVPDFEEIEECLEDADKKSWRGAPIIRIRPAKEERR